MFRNDAFFPWGLGSVSFQSPFPLLKTCNSSFLYFSKRHKLCTVFRESQIFPVFADEPSASAQSGGFKPWGVISQSLTLKASILEFVRSQITLLY